jgi:hypothetical protein
MTKILPKKDNEIEYDTPLTSLSTQRMPRAKEISGKSTSRTYNNFVKISTKTPRVHRKVEFPEYSLKKVKQTITSEYVLKTPQIINYQRKPIQSYFINDGKTTQSSRECYFQANSTEAEPEFEIFMPSPVLLNQGIQVDPLMTKEKLMMEVTIIGELKAAKSRKHTLMTLPYEYIDIGIRKDADNSEELEKLYDGTFFKGGTFKKRRFSGLFLTGEQSVGSTEISPISSKRKLKYYNYNLSDKFQSSCKRIEKHVIDKDNKDNDSEKNILMPIAEMDTGLMEVTVQKEYVFMENVSIKPVRKLEISDPFSPLSLM